MDQILTDLQNPRWWFSAFFIAILASLLAGFLKDALTEWLSRTFDWYRRRKAATLFRREQRLELLATQPNLLILCTLHGSVTLLWFFFFFGMFLITPVYTDWMSSSPSFSSWFLFRPLPGTAPGTVVSTAKLEIILFGLTSLFTSFSAMSELSVSYKAYRRLYARMKAGGVKADPPVAS